METRRGRTRAWWHGVAGVAALAAGFPATAGPTDYCVNTGCGGTDAGSFENAFKYSLSEPARVTITLQRRVAGGRRRTVGTIRRSGAAGNRSARSSVGFRIVRG
jgi:hypothetical protein